MTLESFINTLPSGWNTGFDEKTANEILNKGLASAIPCDSPTRLSGVYLLYSSNIVVYVGQSGNVLSRIGSHVCERVKIFDAYTIIPIEPKLRIMRERQLIRTFSPYYNVTSSADQGFLPLSKIAEQFDVSKDVLYEVLRKYRIPWAFTSGYNCLTKPEFFEPYIDKILVEEKVLKTTTKLLF